MSKTDESPSPSDLEREPASRRRPFGRDAWRELNAAQLVCIAMATVSGMFGFFGGMLVLLSALMAISGAPPASTLYPAALPSGVSLVLALGAVVFTKSCTARRAARQESGPAVLMALVGLLGVAIGWLAA